VNEHFIQNPTEDPKIISFKQRVFDKLSLILKKICVRYADRIIAMNEYCRDVADKLSGSKNKDIVTVSLGVDISEIYFKTDKRELIRSNFNIKTDEVLLVHSGKMHKAKKTELLLEYLKNTKFKNVKLMLVGSFDSEYKNLLWRLIEEYKINDRIIYIPFVKSEELHHYFSAADIAVWPDSATISTIEASAVGIPVIVADFFGYEHRTRNNSGLRVKRGDLIDLTNKLDMLIGNNDLRMQMGKNARKMTEKHLNWEKIAYKILAN
jgi:glycosyltransferase involved in cell wall biosynthesis